MKVVLELTLLEAKGLACAAGNSFIEGPETLKNDVFNGRIQEALAAMRAGEKLDASIREAKRKLHARESKTPKASRKRNERATETLHQRTP